MISYLARLTERLLPGMLQETPQRRGKFRSYFLSALDSNGGFRGRKGKGDIYYSAFALRGLFLLGTLQDDRVLRTIVPFLEQEQRRDDLSPAEILSWTFCATLVNTVQDRELLPEQIDDLLSRWEHFRCADGGYAASAKTVLSSTYTTFLSAIFFELLGKSEYCRLISTDPICERQRSDGGFVELPPLRYSGTNPTAAAVGLLSIHEKSLPDKEKTVEFLCQRQQSDGGFQPHPRMPVSDLLSSFSALMALYDLGAEDEVDRRALRNYVTSLRSPDGGFFGLPVDQQSDVEYTFYGMVLEAML